MSSMIQPYICTPSREKGGELPCLVHVKFLTSDHLLKIMKSYVNDLLLRQLNI